MAETKRMSCANCNFAEREFLANDDGDYTCPTCGNMQETPAKAAKELCEMATWHDLGEYQRYAQVARKGGYTVSDQPAYFQA